MAIKRWTRPAAIKNEETFFLRTVSNPEHSRPNRSQTSSSLDNLAAKSALALLTVLCGLFATPALAATTGSISGTVTDARGAVLPDTSVLLRETLTGVAQTITTDSAGFYNFPSLPIGHYEVTFEKPGFEKYLAANIVIDVDTARRVDATLKIGSTSEEVKVTATDAQVDTESPQMGEVITSKQIADIPLDGRSYTDLLALQPGVAPIQTQQYSTITPSNTDNNGLGSIAGAQDVHSGFIVNGANVVDGAGEGTFLVPNLDSIAEFRIVTNNAGAEYGGYAGGMTNVVTKSGTSQFHGDAFEYLRNGDMNSRGEFAVTGPTLHQNIFGGTAGGPIPFLHKKVFFFADYQGRRNSDNGGGVKTDIMSDADRTGDLTDEQGQFLNNPKTVSSSYMAALLSNRLSTTVTQGEAYYYQGCYTGSPTHTKPCVFPGTSAADQGPIIPSSAWDPVAKNAMQFIPKANGIDSSTGKADYTSPNNLTTLTDNKAAIRIDANTSFGTLWGYYHVNPWDNPSPPTFGNDFIGFTNDTNGEAQLYVVGLSTPIGSTAVNTFTASYTRNKNITGSTGGFDVGAQFSTMGFASVANGGPYEEAPTQYQNWPTLGLFGQTVGPQIAVVTQYNNLYEGQEDFSKVVTTHTFKVGAMYHWDQVDLAHANNGSNGAYYASSHTTGYNVADSFIGDVSTFEQGTPSFENLRTFYAGIYAEDSWRATHDLTVNYGVRWEVDPWWREAHNRNAMALLGVQSTQFPTAPLGYVFPGDPGVPAHMANINWHDFGPRVGLSYAPDFKNPALHALFGDNGKSSIRVGYGLYYTNIEGYNTFNFSAPPYHLFHYDTSGVLLSTPFVGQNGSQITDPFPLNPLANAKTLNWAQFGKPSILRNPVVNEPSPYEEHIDFSVERELTSKTLLSASYVGTFGHHLTAIVDANSGNPALCLSLSQANEVMPNTNTCGPSGESGTYYPVGGGVVNGTRGPFGNTFAGVGHSLDIGNSNYNALFMSLRHTTDRLTFLVSYTFSKAIDNGSGRGDFIFAEDPNHFRSLSIYDVPNNFAASYAYELPFDMLVHGHDRVFRGWKVSGETLISQGTPLWMADDGNDLNLRGDHGVSPWSGFDTDMPEVAPGPLFGGPTDHNFRHPNAAWINYSLYSFQPLGGQGNAPRRSIIGPGNDNTNLRLEKSVKVREGMTAAFQADFYNAFNHANLVGGAAVCTVIDDCGLPSINSQGVNTGGTFGMWGGSPLQGRIGELGAKFTF